MLNRTPPPSKPASNKPNTSNVISSYRKRRMQRGPILLYSAIGLVVIGVIAIIISFMGGEGSSPLGDMFATETSTPTSTFTPTSTSTPTMTSTVTDTPTITFTPTPSEPFPYTIIEGDTLQGIAEKYNLGDDGVLLLLDYNPAILENNGIYYLGQTIIIPPPGTTRATSTPIPANLSRGTRIEYKVLPGDTLAGIAAKFNSKEEDIISINSIEDANALNIGDILQIPVNLITATATLPPTSTPVTPTIEGQPSQTPVPDQSTAPCDFTTNAEFVTNLASLVNAARKSEGLAELKVNEKLTASANEHAVDMVCNNYLSHISLEGTTPEERVAAQDYTASLVIENIYALPPAFGINAQSAFNWWSNNLVARGDLLNPNTTEFGIAYVESEESLLGGYFVMVSAKP